MDFSFIFAWVVSVLPVAKVVLEILGGLVVVGQVVVMMTSSKSDDAYAESLLSMPIVGNLLKSLIAFAPIQKK